MAKRALDPLAILSTIALTKEQHQKLLELAKRGRRSSRTVSQALAALVEQFADALTPDDVEDALKKSRTEASVEQPPDLEVLIALANFVNRNELRIPTSEPQGVGWAKPKKSHRLLRRALRFAYGCRLTAIASGDDSVGDGVTFKIASSWSDPDVLAAVESFDECLVRTRRRLKGFPRIRQCKTCRLFFVDTFGRRGAGQHFCTKEHQAGGPWQKDHAKYQAWWLREKQNKPTQKENLEMLRIKNQRRKEFGG